MVPDTLYKYTTAKTALINLKTNSLRWSSPKLFNDPSEFKRIPRFEPSLDKALEMFPNVITEVVNGSYQIDESKLTLISRQFLQLVKICIGNGIDLAERLKTDYKAVYSADKAYAEVMKLFADNDLINKARILCLTNNPTNPAMWANYADSNTGCLLGFRHIPELDTPLQEAKKVHYSSEKTIVGSGLDFFLYGGTPESYKASLNDICFTKRQEWSYEQEWRVMSSIKSDDGELYSDYKFYEEELESVTFGLKASEETKATVNQFISTKYHKCKLFQIHEVDGELIRKEIQSS